MQVSDYQFAALDGVLPNPIATVNSFTGQLVGAALSGSGGLYAYNLTQQDVFGAVGWSVIHLEITEPSAIAGILEKLVVELIALLGVLVVLFVLWHRDQVASNTVHLIRDLAKLYCSSMQTVRVLTPSDVTFSRVMYDVSCNFMFAGKTRLSSGRDGVSAEDNQAANPARIGPAVV